MTQNIFIAATEPNSGKSAISIGLIEAFERIVPRVGYMKPIGQRYRSHAHIDDDAALIKEIFQLKDKLEDMSPVAITDAQTRKDTAYDRIIESYKKIAENNYKSTTKIAQGAEEDKSKLPLENMNYEPVK